MSQWPLSGFAPGSDDVAALTKPQAVYWCDGSRREIEELYGRMVAEGSLVRLDPAKHPGCYYARSHVNDVARVEDRTFICCPDPANAGPTNNWRDPAEMHAVLEPDPGRLHAGPHALRDPLSDGAAQESHGAGRHRADR